GHVLDERPHICPHTSVRITLAPRVDPTLAGLVPHVDRRNRRRGLLFQARQRKRDDCIQPRRTLATANHENPDRPASVSKATRRRRDRADVLTHGIADCASTYAAAEAPGKRLEHFVRQV